MADDSVDELLPKWYVELKKAIREALEKREKAG